MKHIIAVTILIAGFCGPAAAGTREDVLSGAERCASVTNDRRWLDCFYGSAQPMRSQLGLPPAPASQTALVPAFGAAGAPVPPAPAAAPQHSPAPENFWGRMLGGQVVLSKVPVSGYSFDSFGYFTVTLTNGQVWQQQDDDHLAHWNKPATHYTASISKGALSSYNLSVSDDANSYKVRRLR